MLEQFQKLLSEVVTKTQHDGKPGSRLKNPQVILKDLGHKYHPMWVNHLLPSLSVPMTMVYTEIN